jgi:hypothetical protein
MAKLIKIKPVNLGCFVYNIGSYILLITDLIITMFYEFMTEITPFKYRPTNIVIVLSRRYLIFSM